MNPSCPQQQTVALRGAAAAMQCAALHNWVTSAPLFRHPERPRQNVNASHPLNSAWKTSISEGRVD